MSCKKSGFKSSWLLVGPIETQGHILSMSTWYIAVDATPSEGTKYRNEIKYDVIWSCSFCFKFVHVNSPFNLSLLGWSMININAVLFYMLGINCIKLVEYFSLNTFPKI